MALTPRTRIGPYEVLGSLGAGGMGEVYRARDEKLKRDVAIKVLPADVANDRERLARFQREAEVLASLNHPNIAHVYGLEVNDPPEAGHHLVMELVDGEDLSQRIARGPIPIDEALPIAKQIAEALEAAHQAGIVHRDLKPGNIKVRDDGRVTVLDFGLAKASEWGAASRDSGAGNSIANSPTITSPAMTMRGVILGTAAYMAPEQAKGKSVDKRADIWAFGCVLYEMLTGRKAFDGEDVTDMIAAVLSKEPDWSRLPAGPTPPAIQRLLRRCLVKDRKNRLPDIGVARLEIEEALTNTGELVDAATSSSQAAWRVAALLAIVVIALAAGWMASRYFSPPPEAPAPTARFQVDAADGTIFTQFAPSFIALSADGRQLAYIAQTRNSRNDTAELWVRSFADGTARKLPNTAGVTSAFWSPDGSAVAFVVNGRLQSVAIGPGTTQTIAALDDAVGVGVRGVAGTWGRDGVILFGQRTIMQVSAGGGTPTAATKLDDAAGEVRHYSPSFLPDGRRFLFSAYRRDGSFALRLGQLGSQESRVIGDIPSGAQYVEPGYLVYARDARLWARGFDANRGEWTGDPIVVADAVRQLSSGAAGFTTSFNGTIAFDASSVFGLDVELTWVKRDGTVDKALATINGLHTVALDSSNRMLALEHSAGPLNAVWLMDVVRGTRSRFTAGGTAQGHPIWSPDGTQVAFFDGRPGTHTRLFIKPATGTGVATPVSAAVNDAVASRQPTDWSRDGRLIVYEEGVQLSGADLKYVDLTGTGQPEVAIESPANERNGQLSPDGRFIAYESNESGQIEIYVSTFPKADNRWTISSRGGTKPRWLKDGRELVFVDADGVLQSVSIDATGGSIRAGIPVALFPLGAVDSDGFNYVPSNDGSKFIVMRAPATARGHRVSVIMNWPASLKGNSPQ